MKNMRTMKRKIKYKYYNDSCLNTGIQHSALGDITLKHES
jgi:hypothetical protein